MNNTIFDDVFRTMIEKMPYLAVPLINEVFHTSYPENVPIVQLRNEHQQENGEIITDSCLKIAGKLYHIECQSVDDTDNAVNSQQAEESSVNANMKSQTISEDQADEATDVSASALNLATVNFSEDTLMEWPVNGHVLIDYSMDQSVYFPTLDQYKLSPAISVQAVEGAPVVSAVNGTVYSIENNAQTGTTVTMELGNGYQAIYGQLTDLDVAEGDTVTKGSIIGYVAAPTIYYSEEGSNLYFAMKKDGEPIDPITYLP